MAMMITNESAINDRLMHVLEWLYVSDNAYDNKNEWREALIGHLYWLAEYSPESCNEEHNDN